MTPILLPLEVRISYPGGIVVQCVAPPVEFSVSVHLIGALETSGQALPDGHCIHCWPMVEPVRYVPERHFCMLYAF